MPLSTELFEPQAWTSAVLTVERTATVANVTKSLAHRPPGLGAEAIPAGSALAARPAASDFRPEAWAAHGQLTRCAAPVSHSSELRESRRHHPAPTMYEDAWISGIVPEHHREPEKPRPTGHRRRVSLLKQPNVSRALPHAPAPMVLLMLVHTGEQPG